MLFIEYIWKNGFEVKIIRRSTILNSDYLKNDAIAVRSILKCTTGRGLRAVSVSQMELGAGDR